MKKKIKCFLFIPAFLLLQLMFITGCKSVTTSTDVFGLSTYTNDTKTKILITELKKEVRAIGGRVIVVDALKNTNTQIQQIRTFANNSKITGIFVQLINTGIFDEVTYITQNTSTHKIPTVFLEGTPTITLPQTYDDNLQKEPIVKTKNRIAEIHSLSKQAGTLQAQFIIKKLSNKGRVALLTKPLDTVNETAYTQEIDNVFSRISRILITHQQPANSRRMEAISIVENWINNKEKIDAIITSDDKMALGASLVLQENNLNIPIVSIGGSDEALKAIQNAVLDMTLTPNIHDTARIGVKTMLQITKGQQFIPVVDILPILVTKENVSKFINP